MSWFDWLKSKPAAPSGDSGHTMDLSAGDHHNDAAFRTPGSDVDFKAQRQTRRENLYAVVREAMIRSEVLASRYKFKVLSLDTHGRQFLVMVDLMDATALPAHRFLAVEQLIVSHAAQQHGLFVKSVYWRSNEALPEPHHAPVASARPEVREVPAVPAPVSPAPVVAPAPAAPAAPARPKKAFDPIDQDEVMAFKKAIGALPGDGVKPTPGQVRSSGARKPGYMMGYEDTQLLDQEEVGSPLSRTQFGEL
jgi:hypothetical protein